VIPGFDALALARIFYLAGIVGAFASVRILAGLLLALAPFFVTFLLFEGTRGLFEGWLRALLGAALGALGVAIVLGIELAILETWLSNILAARAARISVPNAPVELLVTTAAFAVVLGAMLFALARVAMGFRLGAILSWTASLAGTGPKDTSEARPNADSTSEPVVARSRAIAISDAVAASQRREEQAPAAAIAGASRVPIQAVARDTAPPPPTPLGHTFRRRATARVSASAGRRDQR
jgi:type IV secretion system protein VirB6